MSLLAQEVINTDACVKRTECRIVSLCYYFHAAYRMQHIVYSNVGLCHFDMKILERCGIAAANGNKFSGLTRRNIA